MGLTVIYARISQDRTGDEAGVERQERECRELAEKNGWHVDRVMVDNDISATTGEVRPAFEEILTLDVERVITWHTDRFVRLTRDLERVIERGFPVYALHAGYLDLSTPAGKAVARTITAWATYEGEQKAVRQRAQSRQRVSEGKPNWTIVPFGYDRDGQLVPAEAGLIRDAYGRILRGDTWAAIARDWNALGMETRKGAEWDVRSVRDLLTNPRNAGLITYQGEEAGKGAWVPIVEEGEWRAALKRKADTGAAGNSLGKRIELLSGLATCSVCGVAVHRRLRKGNLLYSTVCGHASVKVEWLDRYVGNALVKWITSPANILRFGPDASDHEAHAAALRLDELDGWVDELYSMRKSRRIDASRFNRELLEAETEQRELRPIAERLYHPNPLGKFTGPSEAMAAWREMDPLAKRALLDSELAMLKVYPRPRGKWNIDPKVGIKWRREVA